MVRAPARMGAKPKMPVVRYFLFVGGVLLALLLLSNVVLPQLPVEAAKVEAGPNISVIRIYSDRKLPERVGFDTNLPTIGPPQAATILGKAPAPTPGADVLGQSPR